MWLPFAITTVAVGVDFIAMTARVPGGLVDHVHQVLACARVADAAVRFIVYVLRASDGAFAFLL